MRKLKKKLKKLERKANQLHQCFWCDGYIAKSEKYIHVEYGWENLRFHHECCKRFIENCDILLD